MKETKDVICCVIDFGMFMPFAESLANDFKKVYYHTPSESGTTDIKNCMFGDGFDNIERLDDFWELRYFKEIDLFVFPANGYFGMQEYLVSVGKKVWGSHTATRLETMRDEFLKCIKDVGLRIPKYEVVEGLTNLRKLLEKSENKFIKINRFRRNMETWKHTNYLESRMRLDSMACIFGPFQDKIKFVVQDEIDTNIEVGYDGFCIQGQWPKNGIIGYESKDKVYLATAQPLAKMPRAIRDVNSAFGEVLKKHNYCNFFSSEIRLKTLSEFYFIDPTCRMPSPAGEEQLDMYVNLGDIVWKGSHGECVEPKMAAKFCGESLIRYKGDSKELDLWKTVVVPEKVRKWTKLYGCAKCDDLYCFIPDDQPVIGCVVGIGNTIKEVIDSIKNTASQLDCCVEVEVPPLANVLVEIKEAEKLGIRFTEQEIPKPSVVL